MLKPLPLQRNPQHARTEFGEAVEVFFLPPAVIGTLRYRLDRAPCGTSTCCLHDKRTKLALLLLDSCSAREVIPLTVIGTRSLCAIPG